MLVCVMSRFASLDRFSLVADAFLETMTDILAEKGTFLDHMAQVSSVDYRLE